MTPSQWIYYFATELERVAPYLTYADALGVARSVEVDGEPEAAARRLARKSAQCVGPAKLGTAVARIRRIH
jgi:hypothetical protein